MTSKLLLLIISIFMWGCDDLLIKEADKLYDYGKYTQAVSYYEKYINIKKNTELSEYAAYRAATIYHKFLSNCNKSSYYFEFIVKNFPNSKYLEEAKFRAVFCPNYFYPAHKKYILADSQTYGKSAREIIKVKRKTFYKIDTVSEIYAGKKLLSSLNKSYIVKGSDIFEKVNGKYSFLFKYPFKYNTTIEENDIITSYNRVDKVEVKAGVFTNCVAIKKERLKQNTGTIYYYAPEIGKILVTSFYKDNETRIMELVSYE